MLGKEYHTSLWSLWKHSWRVEVEERQDLQCVSVLKWLMIKILKTRPVSSFILHSHWCICECGSTNFNKVFSCFMSFTTVTFHLFHQKLEENEGRTFFDFLVPPLVHLWTCGTNISPLFSSPTALFFSFLPWQNAESELLRIRPSLFVFRYFLIALSPDTAVEHGVQC